MRPWCKDNGNSVRLWQKDNNKLAKHFGFWWKEKWEHNGHDNDYVNERSHTQHSHTHALMSTFPQRIEQHGEQEPTFLEMQDQFKQDWFDVGFGAELCFKDYVDLRMRYSKRHGHYNNEIKRKIGKLNLSIFYGPEKTSTQAWV